MTTYLGEKAVGIGTIRATKAVAGDVQHDGTLVGNGNTEPLGVNKQVIATTNQVANLSATLHAEIEEQAGKITKLDSKKIDKDQGATNAGKYLMVGGDGIVGLSESGGDVIHNNTMVGAGKKDSPLGVNTEVIATKSDIPTKTSQLKNDSGFLTEHQDISGKQDKLTAGENITIENGVISATGGGGELPDNVLVNKSTNASSIMINLPTDNLFGNESSADCVIVGPQSRSPNKRNIIFGKNIVSSFSDNVCIGWDFSCVGTKSIFITADVNYTGYWESKYQTAIGYKARTGADYAIQLGSRGPNEVANNIDANTFKVANANGNFEMMSADGTIPLERLTKVTDQIGDISTALTAILGE